MNYFFLILMIVLNVIAFPWFDARQIKRGYEINHTGESLINFFISVAFAIVLFAISDIFQNRDFEFITWFVVCGITAVITRWAFFDYSLNLFRTDGGRDRWNFWQRLNYSSKTTSSKVDQWERRLGINENVIRILGIVVFIAWAVFLGRINPESPLFKWL